MKGNIIATRDDLYKEVISGLKQDQKQLSSKFFYDEKGSQLFDKITRLEEYYPTRIEMMIMKNNIEEIKKVFSEDTLFIEYGSGSSLKTRLLLSNINSLAGYMPIDISEEHLLKTVASLNERYPKLDIYPIVADYTKPIDFPEIKHIVKHRIGYFPGSTIGNFAKDEAKEFLKVVAQEVGGNGGLLIGVDLKKDKRILEAAYDDAKGVTAQFNLNILAHINNEFEFDFDLSKFGHKAFYNEEEGRVEMHLLCKEDHTVTSCENVFEFKEGETILTEYSHKYSLDDFAALASEYYRVENVWTDVKNYFSVQYLSVL